MPSDDQPRHDTTLGLLDEARDGSETAIGRLYARLLPAARRWAHGRLPRGARGMLETEDIVQETLVRTLAHVKTFKPEQDHGIYLYVRRALRNRLADEVRRVRRRPQQDKTLQSHVPGGEASPLEEAIGHEAVGRYEQALELLKPDERAMVVARIEFGLSWREIAEVAGKASEDAARVAVSRAMKKLARTLGPQV